MKLSKEARAVTTIVNTSWKRLQVEQMVHDQVYHADIYYMDNPHKVEHFALHFSKYAGRIVECEMVSSPHERSRQYIRTMCDTLAILMGTTFALKIDMDTDATDLPGSDIVGEYVAHVGRIAGAYLATIGDRRTHMEDMGLNIAPRDDIFIACRKLRNLAVFVLCQMSDDDPIDLYRQSLKRTRERHFAHEYLNGLYESRLGEILSTVSVDN